MTRLGAPTSRRGLSGFRSRTRVGIVASATLVLLGQTVLNPGAADAATNLSVTTTADVAANAGACGNSSIVTAPSPLSLREATCLANNIGGTVNISVSAGTYNLTNGELAPGIAAGSTISLAGAGAASTIINAGGHSRVIDLDKNIVGGVSTAISGVTITGGADSTFGGAGIIAGSGNATTADVLNLSGVIVTGNAANGANMKVTNKPGGGVQFLGGQLTITNSTISNNSSGSSPGSGVAYGANGAASPEGLSISNTTFAGNSTVNSAGDPGTQIGGALSLFGVASRNFTVADSRFVNNTSTSVNVSGPAIGAAIWEDSGNLAVTESTFTGNSVSGGNASNSGGAIEVTSGTAALHYNRFVGNTAPAGSAIHSGGTGSVDASENWFGCNAGPGSAGCDTVAGTATGTVTDVPRLVLSATASPSTVVGSNGTSTISARVTTDSAGATVAGSNLDAFDALPATFSDPPGDATVTTVAGPHTAAFGNGTGHADIDYHSGTVTGPDPVNVTLDNQTVTSTVTVDQPPAITSPNTAHFNAGSAGSFTVTTTGYPTAAITESGALPPGLTFVDNGDGTATLSGTSTGSGGTFPLNLTAANAISPKATQTLTVTVGQPPAITSANATTFTTGTAGTFTVTTSGIPTVSSITRSGTLPSGVTFTDNGNGTATLAGTPAVGSGGSYPLTLTASNGVTPNATQNFTLQVNQGPSVTTNPQDQTVNPGTSVSFTAAASGVPTPTVQWQRSTNGGASYTNVAGATSTTYTFTTVAGDNGNRYRAVFTNAAGTATTSAATLSVGTAPAFTSANTTTFAVGTAGQFNVTTSGVPNATLSRTGAAFPSWLTLTDNGDGSGSLTGTPPAGSGGTYTFTLKAANGFSPSASQTFTLAVDETPTITSIDHATFTVGAAGSFAVTTTAGYPTSTAITKTGTLPSGVTLHDNGDGTATLAGTPATGSGGSYPITVKAAATGGNTAPASQSFTLTVNEAPRITSTDHHTFAVGASGSFTVTTAAGYPTGTSLGKAGTLPPGLTFHDNGDGTATIAGTPNQGSGGDYTLTLTATNTTGHADQTFTLAVTEAPRITSVDRVTFQVGVAAAFTVTTSPADPATVALTKSGALPAGITFADHGDGTAIIGGTATAGSGGSYPLNLTASNGVAPDGTQAFTLKVTERPTITSADHTTFTAVTAGTFTVTTTAGYPAATTLSKTGALPAGVTLVDNGNGTATLAGTPAAGSGGSYPLTITATNSAGGTDQAFSLTVDQAPTITSADHTTFRTGTAGTFTVTTSAGYPTPPTLSEAGALPAGVTFVDNGHGTATLAGTPTADGVYPLSITASNGVLPNATQSFTLTVNSSPSITSADHTTFAVGTLGTFTVTTHVGTPSTTTLTETGDLPAGVTFHDNSNGTATLTGTPTSGSGGSYPLTFTASNGVLPDATQSFTLTVTALPAITSADHATFTAGTAGSFTVTTTAGYPTSTTLSKTGALPAGVTFVDNGDGTATVAGTPAAGSGGSYPLTVTATNSAGHTDQAFTITVNEPSAITSADHATFVANVAGSFTVTTAGGYPTPPSLSSTGTLPAGVTFVDNGDGTATLSGTPTASGVYALVFTAESGPSVDATQHFTLTVNGPPSFTSDNTMTFTAGVAGSFTVTTHAGVPASPITLSSTGALPSGVQFHDNGDGTATLAGTPSKPGDYRLTFTASNGVAPDATQAFTLRVTAAATVTLPGTQPASNGSLHGVPPHTRVGQVLHVSGNGFAAGARITIGVYTNPVVVGHATADANGAFTATITVPNLLGRHTFVAAGIARDGRPQYLEAQSVISAAAPSGTRKNTGNLTGNGTSNGTGTGDGAGAGTAYTGLDINPFIAIDIALLLLLVGAVLLGLGRRRRSG